MNAVLVNEKGELIDKKVPISEPSGHDVLIAIKAVSVNPVDFKQAEQNKNKSPKILGYDAIGEVVKNGYKATKYNVGDMVFYAGTTTRNGSNADYQLVDERITSKAPKKIEPVKAVALPLTWLTAYEILIDKLNLSFHKNVNQGTVLIINGAGGVGSITIQLAKWLGLKVFATSSPQNFEWLKKLGCDIELDYHQSLVKQVYKNGYRNVNSVINLYDTAKYFDEAADLISPFGHIANIVETEKPLPLQKLQSKSASFDWELMFTKFDQGYNFESQGSELSSLAKLLENHQIKSTLTKCLNGPIKAQNLKTAYDLLRSHKMKGKIVISNENK